MVDNCLLLIVEALVGIVLLPLCLLMVSPNISPSILTSLRSRWSNVSVTVFSVESGRRKIFPEAATRAGLRTQEGKILVKSIFFQGIHDGVHHTQGMEMESGAFVSSFFINMEQYGLKNENGHNPGTNKSIPCHMRYVFQFVIGYVWNYTQQRNLALWY